MITLLRALCNSFLTNSESICCYFLTDIYSTLSIYNYFSSRANVFLLWFVTRQPFLVQFILPSPKTRLLFRHAIQLRSIHMISTHIHPTTSTFNFPSHSVSLVTRVWLICPAPNNIVLHIRIIVLYAKRGHAAATDGSTILSRKLRK